MKTQQAILDTLKTVPAFAAILQEMESSGLAERQILIDQLAELDAEAVAHLAPLHLEAARLTAEVETLTRQLRTATLAKGSAITRAFDASAKVTRNQKALEARILSGADSRLNRFQTWCQRAENLATFASYRAEPLAHNGREPGNATLRAVALAKRIKSLCRDAIDRASELRMEALSADDIGLELEAMSSAIHAEFQKLPSGTTMYQMPSDYMAPLM